MAFSAVSKKNGKTYYLHSREQELRGGKTVTLYYFAGDIGPNAVHELPPGRVVSENERSGLPILKKG